MWYRDFFHRVLLSSIVLPNFIYHIWYLNKIDGLDEFLIGPTALAISYEEAIAPARVIKAFAKEHQKPIVKGVLFEGEILNGEQFQRIANLPDKDQLLAILAAMLKSPLTKFVSAISSPMIKLVTSLNSLKEKNNK